MQISIRSMSIANNLKMATSQQKMRSLSLLGMWGVLGLSRLGITTRRIHPGRMGTNESPSPKIMKSARFDFSETDI